MQHVRIRVVESRTRIDMMVLRAFMLIMNKNKEVQIFKLKVKERKSDLFYLFVTSKAE